MNSDDRLHTTLVSLAAGGDPSAFYTLVEPHIGEIHAILAESTADPASIADAVAAFYASSFAAFCRTRPALPFEQWHATRVGKKLKAAAGNEFGVKRQAEAVFSDMTEVKNRVAAALHRQFTLLYGPGRKPRSAASSRMRGRWAGALLPALVLAAAPLIAVQLAGLFTDLHLSLALSWRDSCFSVVLPVGFGTVNTTPAAGNEPVKPATADSTAVQARPDTVKPAATTATTAAGSGHVKPADGKKTVPDQRPAVQRVRAPVTPAYGTTPSRPAPAIGSTPPVRQDTTRPVAAKSAALHRQPGNPDSSRIGMPAVQAPAPGPDTNPVGQDSGETAGGLVR